MNQFTEIIGHGTIIEYMQDVYQQRRLSHAYIIEGEAGLGKRQLAMAFAKLLQCRQPENNQACGQCPSCQKFDTDNHPDVIFVVSTNKTGYGVDDIRRQILDDLPIKPYESDYKIYIVDQADTMTFQAQNALLKSIEEPPAYGLFLLLAENSRLFLPTILSRCLRLPLKPVSFDLMSDYFQRQEEEKNLQWVMNLAGGNPGKAQAILDDEQYNATRQEMLAVLEILVNGQDYDIMEKVTWLEEDDFEMKVGLLRVLIRDCLVLSLGGKTDQVINCDFIERYQMLQQPERLFDLYQRSHQALEQLKANVNRSLVIYRMLFDIKEKE